MKIAVLLTCFNRKDKTLKCLNHLKNALLNSSKTISSDIYLTDDGSTDGTSEAVANMFPEVTILSGNGNLFWVNGMNNSWNYAINQEVDYEGYLLLNDDTYIFENFFDGLLEADKQYRQKFNRSGVYIGTTIDPKSEEITYGGSRLTNRLMYTFKRVIPGDRIQSCDLGNANIMYVSSNVQEKVGVLSKGYLHGIGDYDYTLKCLKHKITPVIMPGINGYCEFDHKEMYEGFEKLSFEERKKYLYSPLGIDFKSRLLYMKRHFPFRAPLFYLIGMFKLYFPLMYKKLFNFRD